MAGLPCPAIPVPSPTHFLGGFPLLLLLRVPWDGARESRVLLLRGHPQRIQPPYPRGCCCCLNTRTNNDTSLGQPKSAKHTACPVTEPRPGLAKGARLSRGLPREDHNPDRLTKRRFARGPSRHPQFSDKPQEPPRKHAFLSGREGGERKNDVHRGLRA